jgi:threonine dehydrogenase-like Zn-dependent dehydrogenase
VTGVSRAMVLQRPRLFVEREFDLPEIKDDEFLLRVDLVTICGGDVIEYKGGNRKAKYPLLMGHEVVGTIVDIGHTASVERGLSRGDRVMVEPYLRCGRCGPCISGNYAFCSEGMVYGVTIPSSKPPYLWGGYSQFMYGAPGARTHKIRKELPTTAGCMVTVIGNGVRWIRTRGRLQVGEAVLVTGLGVQALASVLVAKRAGAGCVIVACRERALARHALAREFGADHIICFDAQDPEERLRAGEEIRGIADGGPQLAVECTGADGMYSVAIDVLAPMGRLVSVGTRGGELVSVDIDAIVFKEIDVRGGLGQAGDTELAAKIVNEGSAPIERMVTHRFPLNAAAEALELMMQGRDDVIHVALDPWGSD